MGPARDGRPAVAPRQRPILCSNDAATGLDMPSGPPAA